MPQLTEPADLPDPPFDTTGLVFADSTIHVTANASRIRPRPLNAFGTTTMPITAVTLARPLGDVGGSPAVDSKTVVPLTFSGAPGFSVPNVALVVSDPVDFDVVAGTELSVSVFMEQGQVGNDITSHLGSRTTSWMVVWNQVPVANITGSGLQSVAHCSLCRPGEIITAVSRVPATAGDVCACGLVSGAASMQRARSYGS